MKARRQRDLLVAFGLLFEEFVNAGGTTPAPPSDPNGSGQPGDDPPPVRTPPTKPRAAAKTARRPAR
jgi:hypothetical protein